MTHAQNHEQNVYLTVTLSPSATFFSNPDTLAGIHPHLTYVGPVGELRDVQLLSTPRAQWDHIQGEVLAALNGAGGVRRVDVQERPRARAKRGEDEL